VRIRLFLISVASVLAVAAPVAGAIKPTPQPLAVSSSSLTQEAQQLTWKVELTQPFSPAALAHAGRSLCLLVERPQSASVAGQLCIASPRPGRRSPRLVYQRVTRSGPGTGHVIDATVTRAGSRGLAGTFAPASIGIGYRSTHWQVMSTLQPPACTPAKPNRVGCRFLFPRRPALAKLHVPQLVGCVPRGAPFVYSGPANRKVIALTFDDGPWYDTSQFLNLLEHYHVHATFFEIGDQISEYGEGGAVERRMLADGDMIGDHTWNHQDVAAGGSFAAGEISEAAAAIKQATHGFQPCLFRAPYGDVSGALISEVRSMGFTTIQWDIDPRDWALPGVAEIDDNVLANARPGGIVEEHDGGGNRSETLAALPQEIQTLRRRGYQFVTVTQLLGMRLLYK
jgi:peptidoglycan/xylan/chitin deacetylase (PgdA/CDA1 family)